MCARAARTSSVSDTDRPEVTSFTRTIHQLMAETSKPEMIDGSSRLSAASRWLTEIGSWGWQLAATAGAGSSAGSPPRSSWSEAGLVTPHRALRVSGTLKAPHLKRSRTHFAIFRSCRKRYQRRAPRRRQRGQNRDAPDAPRPPREDQGQPAAVSRRGSRRQVVDRFVWGCESAPIWSAALSSQCSAGETSGPTSHQA